MNRTIAGAHPWDLDNPQSQLQERAAAYQRFLARGGDPESRKGKERRREMRQLSERIREERKR
jgi:hypothetical protein